MVDLFNIYQQPMVVIVSLVILSIWELIWKGFGLWHSAKNRQKAWFLVILIFNTLGLLPIIYLIWFKPKDKADKISAARPIITKITGKVGNKINNKAADSSTVVKIKSVKKSKKKQLKPI